MKKQPLALAVALAMPTLGGVQLAHANEQQVFQLGVVEVAGKTMSSSASPSATVVSEEEMQARQDVSVADALARQSGVILSSGSRRAESWAFIRGFDSRQVTLNIDGIPVYIPYDGNIDLNRFLVADLSQIVVSKGLGSLLYGPNNMGGSINLISRKPTKDLEGKVSAGIGFGADGLASNDQSLQLGSKLNSRFYVQGGVSRSDVSSFPLSGEFDAVATQPSGSRLQSQSLSTTGNIKLGYTPNATDEYAISLYSTRGNKGAPPYTGKVPNNVVYWDWPQWDKDSLYFISHTAMGTGYLKSRLYLDKFQNALTAYDDASYSKVSKNSSFRSRYDDSTQGASLEFGQPLANHLLKVAAFYKEDKHRELDMAKDAPNTKLTDSPWLQYRSETTALGIEDEWKLSPQTRLSFGYRKDWMRVQQAEELSGNSVKDMAIAGQKNLDNLQAFVLHDWSGVTLRAGMAQKGRYPSIKEMYSYRLGRAIPNANLQAEQVLHHELGASGKLGSGKFDVALYYSRVNDAIESISISPTLTQMQNVGKAEHTGIDLSFFQPLGKSFAWQVNYGWLKKDLSDKALVATGIPEHRLLSSLSWYARPDTELMLDTEYAGKRQTTTDGLRPVDEYTLWHLRAQYDYSKQTSVNVGIYNLFDTNYQITEGDPMPGRLGRISVTHRF